MNKIDLTVRLSLSVLTAGLVSCAKDEKTRDVFHAPPPVINNKGSHDLKTWDRRRDKSLDLQDSFDVSAGQPAKLQVTARCLQGQRSYVEEFSIDPRAPIKIFQVLPSDLLTADLMKMKYDCGFELVLMNQVGSKHIYQISPVPISDEQGGAIKIELAGGDAKVERFSARKLEGLRARLDDQGETEIFCADITMMKLPFTRVIDLGSFDFSKPNLKLGRPENTLQDSPLQACRILLRKNSGLQQLSDRVLVQFPQNSLVFRRHAVENLSNPQKMAFFKGSPLPVAIVSIGNPDKLGKRRILIDQKPSALLLAVYSYTPTPNGGLSAVRYMMNETFLVSDLTGKVEIPAGGTVHLALRMQPPRASNPHLPPSNTLAVTGAIPFVEVAENGEILGTGEIPLPRTLLEGDFWPDDPQEKAVPFRW